MRQFYALFFNPDMDLDGRDYRRTQYYYNVESLGEHVNESISNYYGIDKMDTFEYYEHINETDYDKVSRIVPVIMTPYFIRNEDRLLYWKQLNYNLTEDFKGPFGLTNQELDYFLSNLTNFKLEYEIRHNVSSVYDLDADEPYAYKWIISQEYCLLERGRISETIRFEKQLDTINNYHFDLSILSRYLWVHVLAIVVSIVFLIYNFIYIKDIINYFEKINNTISTEEDDDDEDEGSYMQSLQELQQQNTVSRNSSSH